MNWQQAIMEAAKAIGLEAHLLGGGLPGSCVKVDFPPMSLLDNRGQPDSPSYVYDGLTIIFSMVKGRNLEYEMYQISTGPLHPHCNASGRSMCIGNGYEALGKKLPRSNTENVDQWIECLIQSVVIMRNHYARGHYQEHGYLNSPCPCLDEFREGLSESSGNTFRGTRSGSVCNGCVRTCSLCRNRFSNSQVYRVDGISKDVFVCENCISRGELHICEGCGEIKAEQHITTCAYSGKEICNSCGYMVGNQMYHRDIMVFLAGTSTGTVHASTCTDCRRGIPNDIDQDPARCNSMFCLYNMQLLGEEYVTG